MASSSKQNGAFRAAIYLAPVVLILSVVLVHKGDLSAVLPSSLSLLGGNPSSLASPQTCKQTEQTQLPAEDVGISPQSISQEMPAQLSLATIATTFSSSAQPTSTCKLQGSVDECCDCTYQAVDKINEGVVYPILKQLVATPFFRYFKVNLWCDCPLWPDDSMCAMRACSVCECEPHELPKPWLVYEGLSSGPSCSAHESEQQPDQDAALDHTTDTPYSDPAATQDDASGCNSALCAAEADGVVQREEDAGVMTKLVHLKGWRGLNNPWMADNEGEDDEDYQYVNLLHNPERYTGYKGEHAHRIWSAIYNQSCFTHMHDCHEKRVFYRLISGMHASISAHIAANYLLDEEAGVWGPSPHEFKSRLGTPEVRHRVENLYFAYLFVLRAVSKAGSLLGQYQYDTGMPEEDTRTTQLIKDLMNRSELSSACPIPFDEGRLWKGDQGPQLLEQMQEAFRNITRVMDCVGCEKCKLWGKLQTLGIATALKVLFSTPDCSGALDATNPFAHLRLERNEVIALLNLLERFAASLHYYKLMSEHQRHDEPSSELIRDVDTVH